MQYSARFAGKVSFGDPTEAAVPRIGLEWMTYLGPRLARFGGLLMAATDEVFSIDDPQHMAVARDIPASVVAFNALKRPYPGLELLED